jgi:hypothetical protein
LADFMEDIQRSHDRFVRELFDQARQELDRPAPESAARSDVRNFLDRVDPRRRGVEPGNLIQLLVQALVHQTMRDRRSPRSRIDRLLERGAAAGTRWPGGAPASPEALFDRLLTPELVRDFIQDCQRFLCALSPEDRRALEVRLGADEGELIAGGPSNDARADLLVARLIRDLKRREGRGP